MIRKNGLFVYGNNDKTSFLLLGIGVLVFIKMIILNFLTPLGLDDGKYSGSASVLDALLGAYNYYMTWGGRGIVQFILRIVLMLPKAVFNVLNALVYSGLILLIYKIAKPKRTYDIKLYLFIIFSVWLYTIFFGQVMLWVTGSVVYLWGDAIILSFLLPYCLQAAGKEIFKHKYISIVGMFLLGVIAGWISHNTSGGMILIAALVLVYCKIFKSNITKWMISGLIGGIIGFLFLTLAPGNFVRSQYMGSLVLDNRNILVVLTERIGIVTNILRSEFAILIMIFIVLVTMQIVLQKNWKRTYISFMFFIASIATVYAMILSPTISIHGRAMSGATIFMIIACAHCLAGISFEKESLKPYKIAVVSFVCILAFQFATSFIIAAEDILLTSVRLNRRANFIQAEISQGNLHVLLPHDFVICTSQLTPWNPRHGFEDITHDISHQMNRCYALNFGIESIRWAP